MPDEHDATPEAPGTWPDTTGEDPQGSGTVIENQDDGMPEAPVRARDLTPHDAAALSRIRELAGEAAAVASDLKAEDIRILTMHDLVTYTDFLVLCTGRSTRQTRRIAEEIGIRLKKADGLLPHSVEGDRTGEWVLLDYLDFIVHVFTPETRDFYRLDNLWKTAPVEVIE